MRLCVIGASHTIALRQAWHPMSPDDRRGIETTFYADRFDKMAVIDGAVTTDPPPSAKMRAWIQSKGITPEARLREHDAFVVVGVGSLLPALSLYGGFRGESHAGDDAEQQLVSDVAFETFLASQMRAEPAGRFTTLLRAETDAPMAILPVPFYKFSKLKSDGYRERLRHMHDEAHAQGLADSYRAAMRRMAGRSVTVIDQPAETLAWPMLTREEFSVGQRVTSKGAYDDSFHMNEAYGRIMMKLCLDWAETVAKGP